MIADYRDNAEMELPRLMYSYELKRVRYLLQAYHRTRLKKIEKFILHILEKEEVLQKLSEKEQAYAQAGSEPAITMHLQPLAAYLPSCGAHLKHSHRLVIFVIKTTRASWDMPGLFSYNQLSPGSTL